MKKAILIFAAAAAAALMLSGGESGLEQAAERLEDGIEQSELAALIFGADGESFV